MTVLQAVAIAFSMFSILPMPQFPWTAKGMRFSLVAFPLVGVVIGLLVWAWIALCAAAGFHTVLFAAGLTVIPVAVSGGIHLDGLADTTDALASHTDKAKRLSIMDDPHTGAFATIALVCYLLVYFAFCNELTPTSGLALSLGCLYVLCRSLSALSIVAFPCAKTSGIAHSFREGASRRGVIIATAAEAAACIIMLVCFCGPAGIAVSIAVLGMFLIYRMMSIRLIGGITGDLAGWFLQWAELLGIAVYAIVFSLV